MSEVVSSEPLLAEVWKPVVVACAEDTGAGLV
jgi:hypothetical protein